MKDSSGGTGLFSAMKQLGVSKPVLGGEDASFLAMLKQGAAGGILASANLRTELFLETYRQFRDGKPEQATNTFQLLVSMIVLLFRESNPAPLKWALSHQGTLASATLRLPMMPISEKLSRQLIKELGRSGISGGH
jgi:4-hydroxy-tetrahydrodipicolinate synthase